MADKARAAHRATAWARLAPQRLPLILALQAPPPLMTHGHRPPRCAEGLARLTACACRAATPARRDAAPAWRRSRAATACRGPQGATELLLAQMPPRRMQRRLARGTPSVSRPPGRSVPPAATPCRNSTAARCSVTKRQPRQRPCADRCRRRRPSQPRLPRPLRQAQLLLLGKGNLHRVLRRDLEALQPSHGRGRRHVRLVPAVSSWGGWRLGWWVVRGRP